MVFKKGVPSKNIALQEHFKYPKDFDHRPPSVVEKSELVDTNCCYCGMISTIYFHPVTQLVDLENRRILLAESWAGNSK